MSIILIFDLLLISVFVLISQGLILQRIYRLRTKLQSIVTILRLITPSSLLFLYSRKYRGISFFSSIVKLQTSKVGLKSRSISSIVRRLTIAPISTFLALYILLSLFLYLGLFIIYSNIAFQKNDLYLTSSLIVTFSLYSLRAPYQNVSLAFLLTSLISQDRSLYYSQYLSYLRVIAKL